MFIFILGGLNSGKTSFAINHSRKNYKIPGLYIATAIGFDDEMKRKIKAHQNERRSDFITIEEPVNIENIDISLFFNKKIKFVENVHKKRIIIFDCLTVWLNNLFTYKIEENWENKINKFISSIKKTKTEDNNFDFIFISNEVNCGNISFNKLTRKYNSYLGLLNIKIANISENVYFMHAGVPVKIKG